MVNAEEKFEEFLKSRELKDSSERKLILKSVLSFNKHFNADDLFEKLRRQNRYVSRATIYRTIPLLLQSGLINETLRYQDKKNYEIAFHKKHHDHLLCVNCGKAIEFYNEAIEKMQNEVCEACGFKPLEHTLEIKGYCKDCYKKMKRG